MTRYPITNKVFKAWLEAMEPEERPCREGFCPIEEALVRLGYDAVDIWNGNTEWGCGERYKNPQWVQQTTERVDRFAKTNWGSVPLQWHRLTARQILECLEGS